MTDIERLSKLFMRQLPFYMQFENERKQGNLIPDADGDDLEQDIDGEDEIRDF